MSKKIKNTDSIPHTWGGVYIEPDATYECQNQIEADYFFKNDLFIIGLSNTLAEVYIDDILIVGISDSLKALSGESLKETDGSIVVSINAFSSKKVGNKNLFKRIHGIQSSVVIGLNTIDFVIPYNNCKMNGVQIIGASIGDTIDFEVYDTPAGLFSGVPNAKLTQFGFGVCIAKDFYSYHSEYDSDVPKDIKLRVKFTSVAIATIGINFLLNELR